MGIPTRSNTGQPPHLNHDQLVAAQAETLDHPRRRYGMPARILFATFDVLYGSQRTLSKLKVLELVVVQVRGLSGMGPGRYAHWPSLVCRVGEFQMSSARVPVTGYFSASRAAVTYAVLMSCTNFACADATAETHSSWLAVAAFCSKSTRLWSAFS